MAIQDAYDLVVAVRALAASSAKACGMWEEMVQEYSDKVAERGAKEVELSIQSGNMLMDYYGAKASPYFQKGLSQG